MFLLLGAFFHVESPALREDISPSKFITQLIHFVVDWNDKFLFQFETRKDGWFVEDDTREAVSEAYSNTAINCYITGAIYAGTLVFAGWQVAVNNSRTYQMAWKR